MAGDDSVLEPPPARAAAPHTPRTRPPANPDTDHRSFRAAMLTILVVGIAARVFVSLALGWHGGDPLFSYTYRAVLISQGHWEGVFLMWHPPGFPLLLALVTTLSGHLVHPYVAGVAVSLVSYVVLTLVIDQLARLHHFAPSIRLVIAGFLGLQETLLLWQSLTVTEPITLVLLFGSILLIVTASGRLSRFLLAGALLGYAVTCRLDAAAFAVAVAAVLLGSRTFGAPRQRVRLVAVLVLGGLTGSGWMLWNVDYLLLSRQLQQDSYTFPPAAGLGPQLIRAVNALYFALTDWLPQVLLLPFWVLCAGALFREGPSTTAARQSTRLLVVTAAAMALLVTMTIMHKRTGSVLLPPLALAFGAGVELLAARTARRPRLSAWVPGLAILLLVIQATRVVPWLARERRTIDPAVVQARLFARAPHPGSVWAFGSEPIIYAINRVARPIDFFGYSRTYEQVYQQNAGNPAAFLSALRARGDEYLSFSLPDDPRQPDAPQVYAPTPAVPAADLRDLRDQAATLGLVPVGTAAATLRGQPVTVHLFRIP